MSEGKDDSSRKKGATPFLSFLLLNTAEFDFKQLTSDLDKDWGIVVGQKDFKDDSAFFEVDGFMVTVALFKSKVPDGEAEYNASTNFRWKEAVEVTKTHKAHLIVAVLGGDGSAVIRGKVLVKLVSSALKQSNAIGVYTSGTVFQPEFYTDNALIINEGSLPILNWIYFGIYRSDKGLSTYTYGMKAFGRDDIEILDADEEPDILYNFLINVVDYILTYDVTLNDGETIGFSETQKLKIRKSAGVSLDGETLKIEYLK